MSSEEVGRRELPSLTTIDNKGRNKNKDKKKTNNHEDDFENFGKKRTHSGIGRVLESIREDIVTSDLPYKTFNAKPITAACISCAGDHCYMEGSRKFKKTSASVMDQAERPTHPSTTPSSTCLTALHLHNAFKTVSLILNGLLAGIVTWQLASLYGSPTPILLHYPPLSLPLHSIYYFATALCLVAALDRYDFSQSTSGLLQQLFSCQSITPLLLTTFHLLGLLTSLSALPWDLSIWEHSSNKTDLSGQDEDSNSGPVTWQVLNIIRAAMAIMAWVVVSFSPREDSFTDVLKEFKRGEESGGRVES